MQTIAITIDDETLQRLERLSGREGARNRSRLIREAVKEYLERLERAREDDREAAIVRRHRVRLAREAAAAVRAQAKR
jgi:metal-responsive CopG/Arc/MetJ family transcriptional regulator